MFLENQQPHDEEQKQQVLKRSRLLQAVTQEVTSGILTSHTLMDAQADIYQAIKLTYPHETPSQNLLDKTIVLQVKNAHTLMQTSNVMAELTHEDTEGGNILWQIIEKMLIYLGYEINNVQDLKLFLPEITDFLLSYDLIHQPNLFSKNGREKLSQADFRHEFGNTILLPIMTFGVNFRSQMVAPASPKYLLPPERTSQSQVESVYTEAFGMEDSLDPTTPPIFYRRHANDTSGIDIPPSIQKAFQNDDFNLHTPPGTNEENN